MLNKEINAGLADPNMKARVADLGGDVTSGSASARAVVVTPRARILPALMCSIEDAVVPK